MGKMLGVAIVISAVVGAIAGLGAGALFGPKAQTIHHATEAREFWVFTVVLPFNDTPGTPHDYFAPDRITVYQGDNITIHFFNTETVAEDHTFTTGAPYGLNHIVPGNTTLTFSFTASYAGIHAYRCSYHQPTMTGWLVVLDN